MAAKARRKRDEIVVFDIIRDSDCSDCGEELGSGSFIVIENDKALCLECADLDHLQYLPRGDAALTRRARKHSRLSPVVVRWSRSRKRYERQGVLAEPEAIERAEQECLEDAELRERRRARNKIRLAQIDTQYVEDFTGEILKHYPGCPQEEANAIAEHACRKHSGRVGRSAAAKAFHPDVIDLAVRAYIRHRHTNYDELLARGWDRLQAREEIEYDIRRIARSWEAPDDDTDAP